MSQLLQPATYTGLNAFHDLVRYTLTNGNTRPDRTGTGTRSVFGHQLRFNLKAGFPLLGAKKTNFKMIVHELIWFLRGDTNIQYLVDNGVGFMWQDWAVKEKSNSDNDVFSYDVGDCGPIYGAQWREWLDDCGNPIDQLKEVIHTLKTRPYSRRHIVSAWNPSELPDETTSPQDNVKQGKMALAPCHTMFQFYVRELSVEERQALWKTPACSDTVISVESLTAMMNTDKVPRMGLSCHMFQRSCDALVGAPANIASYALLTHLMANECDYAVDELIISYGDFHVYGNHLEQAKLMLSRTEPTMPTLDLPATIKISDVMDPSTDLAKAILDTLKGYKPEPFIKLPIAV